MRRWRVDTGWAGSLFDEPIAQGKTARLQPPGRGADGKFHWDERRCLMSECNGWRWYHFEVLQGVRDWVMDNGRNWHTGLRIGELAVEGEIPV